MTRIRGALVIYPSDHLAEEPDAKTVRAVSVIVAFVVARRIVPCAVVIGHRSHLLINLMVKVQIDIRGLRGNTSLATNQYARTKGNLAAVTVFMYGT